VREVLERHQACDPGVMPLIIQLYQLLGDRGLSAADSVRELIRFSTARLYDALTVELPRPFDARSLAWAVPPPPPLLPGARARAFPVQKCTMRLDFSGPFLESLNGKCQSFSR
jgi:hypothetical protein